MAPSIEFWRHDSFTYLRAPGVDLRAKIEGRWINVPLFPLLRRLDPLLTWYAVSFLTLAGLYFLFTALRLDRLTALGLATLGSLFPGVIAQSLWPFVTLSAVSCLLASIVLLKRFGLWGVPLAGIIQFATLSYYFYLLPLMLLPGRVLQGFRESLSAALLGVFWAACLILGFLVSSTWNLIFYGEFGVQIGEFRKLKSITESSSTVEKASIYAGEIYADVLLVIGFALYRWWSSSRDSWGLIVRTSYCIVVALSPYITVFIASLRVEFRSLLPLAIGTIALPFLIVARDQRSVLTDRCTMIALAIAIGVPSFQASYRAMDWYTSTSSAIASALLSNNNHPASGFSKAAIDVRKWSSFYPAVLASFDSRPFPDPFLNTLDRPFVVKAAYVEQLGVQKIQLCPVRAGDPLSDQCAAWFEQEETQCVAAPGTSCYGGRDDKILLFRVH